MYIASVANYVKYSYINFHLVVLVFYKKKIICSFLSNDMGQLKRIHMCFCRIKSLSCLVLSIYLVHRPPGSW